MNKPIISIALAALLPSALFAGVGDPVPVHHWTFDTDGTDSQGGNTMILGPAGSLSDCGRIGGGSLKLEPALDTDTAPNGGDGARSTGTIDPSNWANGDERTVTAWIRADLAPGNANPSIVTFGSLGTNGARFNCRLHNDGGSYQLRNEVAGANIRTTPAAMTTNLGFSNLADAEWHHVAWVLPADPATQGDLLLYIDGVEFSGGDVVIGTGTRAIITGVGRVSIGDGINDANRDFRGFIDDVRLYDVALDSTQINDLIAEADAGGPSVGCFMPADDTIILGQSTDLLWDAFAITGTDVLEITNDQDATVIDADTLLGGNTSTSGLRSVAPEVTTEYTLSLNGTPVASTTVTVQTTPDLLSFTATPDLVYGSGGTTLSWTSNLAGSISISDESGELVFYDADNDTQEFLDAGTFDVSGITTTTTFTLQGWLDVGGGGEAAELTATVTVQANPDLTLVASPTVFSGTSDVTLNFNATVIRETTAIITGEITDFTDDADPNNGFDLTDDTKNFDTLLTGDPADYTFERLTGPNAGTQTEILSWSGDKITLAEDIAGDTLWDPAEYSINGITYGGTDMLVVNDGTSDIFTTTDPTVIANGSFTVTGVSADTTFTATATMGGTGSTMESVSVVATGTGTSYEEVVLADGPLGYYPFNENATSTTIYDASGNGNHSTSIIGSLTQGETGPIGTAHRFNNNETIVTGVTLDPADPDGDGGGIDDPDMTEGFTMEALIRPDLAATGSNRHIWANRDGTGTGRSNLYLNAAGNPQTYIGGGNTTSAADVLDASWCHLAMTVSYDSARDLYVARTYLDGVLIDALDMVTAAGASRPPEAADGAWVIGSHKIRQANSFWEGLLDEVAIYDYALSDAQVAAHSAAFLSNAVGLLAFEGNGRVLRNEPYELFYKVGGGSSSATVDNGGGAVTPGTSGTITVTPGADTTYTLDVDGETRTVTLQVIDPLILAGFGLDNGSGFPFVDMEGITEGISYQLLYSENLQVWTVTGAPILGDASGAATFVDGTALDSATRPQRYYQVRDIADPPAP